LADLPVTLTYLDNVSSLVFSSISSTNKYFVVPGEAVALVVPSYATVTAGRNRFHEKKLGATRGRPRQRWSPVSACSGAPLVELLTSPQAQVTGVPDLRHGRRYAVVSPKLAAAVTRLCHLCKLSAHMRSRRRLVQFRSAETMNVTCRLKPAKTPRPLLVCFFVTPCPLSTPPP